MKTELYNADCLVAMGDIPDGYVDLTVTSPPYDNLRTYNGNIDQWNEQKWKDIIQELFRVTKQGGVVVWVVGDATIKGSETGTSFKQALWAKECGFNLHDTMIWRKTNPTPRDTRIKRYWQEFEYMFVFSKGVPNICNHIMMPTKYAGLRKISINRKPDGSFRDDRRDKQKDSRVKNEKPRSNVWDCTAVPYLGHPAVFPEKLAHDHILSWSNERDTVFDPFMGSGTTGVACKNLDRNFIGIELDETYFKIAQERIASVQEPLPLTSTKEK